MSTATASPAAPDAPASPPAGAAPRGSAMAEGLFGSRILAIAAEIRARVAAGRPTCNLTVGDFAPAEFRIPAGLERRIVGALGRGETNYPPSNGLPALRAAVAALYRDRLGLAVDPETIVVTGGSRPAIYATYRCLVDPGERVVYPAPSWNNDAYAYLVGAADGVVACDAATGFLPTRALLADAVRGARLLALNSPLNPSGTAFAPDTLADVCDLVLEENARRGPGERPLYLMYDQVYWMLTYGATAHAVPQLLRPAIAPYTILVDGISKGFAATGLRVGWLVAPPDLAPRFSDFLGHVGAWAPRAEQAAAAEFLGAADEMDAYLATIRDGARARLEALHAGLAAMRDRGLPVEVQAPEGAIYLSARFAVVGRTAGDGTPLDGNEAIRRWLLEAAGFAAVPFQAFGAPGETGWFRLSVGAVSLAAIAEVLPRMEGALASVR